MEMLGLADTLRELHASSRSSSSNTRLFPVEMSRARKSSETICPERFCGPPQHSEEPADKGAVGLGRVFREIQVQQEQQDVKRKNRLPRGGVEETGGQDLGGGGGRRHKDRNEAHIVSNGAQKKKHHRGQTGSARCREEAAAAQHVRRTQRESKQREQQRPLVDRKRHSISVPSMLTDQNQESISSR